MILAKIRITDVRAILSDAHDIPAGIIGGQIRLEYADPMWDSLNKTVVFRGRQVTKDVLNAGEVVAIPPEVVSRAGDPLYVGVYGTDGAGNIAIPTLWADLGHVRAAADPSGDESTEDSLPVWVQLQEQIDELKENGGNPESGGSGKPGENGGYYTPSVSQTASNKLRFAFTPSKSDMPTVSPVQVTLPVGQGSGGTADLTGYAKEQWVQANYQPKGQYLTQVPEGYAKTDDIPVRPEDIGAQPAGNYLTEVPGGYATEEFVKNKIAEAELSGGDVDLSGYAQKSELPTKVSQLQNDKGYLTEHQDISGKLDASALPAAINTALAQAKTSGEFDGEPGEKGDTGAAGYSPRRGTDYWTAADIAEIKGYVDDAILGGAW